MKPLTPIARWFGGRTGTDGTQGKNARWGESRSAIDALAQSFFAAVSFDETQAPQFERLQDLFIDEGVLVNNTGPSPQVLSVPGFIAARRAAHAEGTTSRYQVVQISASTEIFGRSAHQACIVVRKGTRLGADFEHRGAIFLQCVVDSGRWRFSAAAWDDLRPGQPWATHPEAIEFGG